MKSSRWICIIIGMAVIASHGQDDIRAISLDPKVIWDGYPEGSFEGGTKLYITGVNFDGQENALKIAYLLNGQHVTPLMIEPLEILSPTKIAFRTHSISTLQKAFEDTRASTFHIALKWGSYLLGCNQLELFKCEFRYESKYSPNIFYLSPVMLAGDMARFSLTAYDTYKKKKGNVNYIHRIDAGEGTCDITPYFKPDVKLSYTKTNMFCDLYTQASMSVDPLRFQVFTGYARIFTTHHSYDGSAYKMRSYPSIQSLFPQEGSIGGGQILEVLGEGFSAVKEENSITVGGVACKTTFATKSTLRCVLPAKPASPPASGTPIGLEHLVFTGTSATSSLETVTSGFTGYISRGVVLITHMKNEHSYDESGHEAELLRGYFQPPQDGNYKFVLNNYETTYVYLGNTTEDKSLIVYSNWNYGEERDYWGKYIDTHSKSQSPIPLEASKKYYIEIRHRLYTGGYFSLGFELEYGSAHPLNKRQVQKVSFDANIDYETHYFSILNPPTADSGETYKWRVYKNDNNGEADPREGRKTDPIPVRATAVQFRDFMRGVLPGLSISTPEVTYFDADENEVESPSATSLLEDPFSEIKYKIVIQNNHYKDFTFVNQNTPPSAVISSNSELRRSNFKHESDYVYSVYHRGTYGLSLNHPTLGTLPLGKFYICAQSEEIQRIIDDSQPLLKGKIEAVRNRYDNCYDINEVFFHFIGFDSDLDLLSISTDPEVTNLEGGNADPATHTQTVVEIQGYSTDLFFPFIPTEYLSQDPVEGLVEVETNGMKAGCRDLECGFAYLEGGPSISGVLYDQGTRLLTLTGTGFDVEDEDGGTLIEWVALGSVNCPIQGGATDTEIVCTLDSELIGGVYLPSVKYDKGYFAVEDSVANIEIDYTIDASPKLNLNPNGGQIITFTGTNLPSDLLEEELTITLGGAEMDILKVFKNNKLRIESPPLSASNNPNKATVVLNGLTKEVDLEVGSDSFPTVSTIAPNTGSPVLLKDLTVTISGDLSSYGMEEMKVMMGEQEIGIFDIPTPRNSTSTELKCRFVGGVKGDYQITVLVEGLGRLPGSVPFTVEADFTSVTPSEGSFAGGAELTIAGTGFSDDLDQMYVYFDDTQCVLIAATETEIRCYMLSYLDSSATALPVAPVPQIGQATLRLNAVARCDGECFTMNAAHTPIITATEVFLDGTEYKLKITGDTLDLAGGDLSLVKVTLDGYPQTVESASLTEIVTSIDQILYIGSGKVALSITPYGKAFVVPSNDEDHPTDIVEIPFEYHELKFNEGSNAGSFLIFNGFGFGAMSENFLTINSSSGNICESGTMRVVSIGELECRTRARTIEPAEEVTVYLTVGPTPFPCSNADKSLCVYSTSINYDDLLPTFTFTSNPDLQVDLTFHAETGTRCDSVQIMLTAPDGKRTYESCGDLTAPCSWNAGEQTVGEYKVDILCTKDGDVHILESKVATVSAPIYTKTPVGETETSYGGGKYVEVGRVGIGKEAGNGEVKGRICHVGGEVEVVDDDNIKIHIPMLETNYTVDQMDTEYVNLLSGIPFGDDSESGRAFDGVWGSEYVSDTPDCFAGIQLPHPAVLKRARFHIANFPTWESEICKKMYTETRQAAWLEGSTDGVTYTQIANIDLMITHAEWNPFELPAEEIKYLYYRVKFQHTCVIGEIELYGQYVAETSEADYLCDLNLEFGDGSEKVFSDAIKYKSSLTPQITAISPSLLEVVEGAEVIITGIDLPTDRANIVIQLSGVSCTIETDEDITPTSCTCKIASNTGMSQESKPRISLEYQGMRAVVAKGVGEGFLVAHKWSERVTWSGAPPPAEGDSVLIPLSQALIYDIQSSPVLDTIVVEGTLVFPDAASSAEGKEVLLQARRILVRQGNLLIGSAEAPYQHNVLTIRLFGYKDDKQLPIFGNKFLGIHHGNLQIHGKPKTPTWTNLLQSTTYKDKTIKIAGPITGWEVGDQIIISPSERHNQSEMMVIAGITSPEASEVTIELSKALKHKHTIHTRQAASKIHTFELEVGVLSRNIIFEGDESSADSWFGGIMKVYGGKSTAQIEYLEIRNAGQAYQFGQYAFSFVNIDCPSCYIRHSVFHKSYNRGFALDNAYRINIYDNIAANIDGDGFSVDNVVYLGEVWNTFEHNLAVDMRNAWGFLEKGMVHGSGFFMPGPPNLMIENVVAGTEGPGIYYYTVCYYENHLWPLGTFKDNYVHNTRGDGLHQIFIYGRTVPLTGPTTLLCAMPYNHDIRYRPGPRRLIENFKAFKNSRNIYFFDVGNMDMKNILVSDAGYTGWMYTATDHLEIIDVDGMIIISKERGSQYGLGTGVWSDTRMNNITFTGFNKSLQAIRVCIECIPHFGELYWMSWSNVTWEDSPNRMIWTGHDFYTDIDGTFAEWKGNSSTVQEYSTLTVYEPHLDHPDHCQRLSPAYGEALICTSAIKFGKFFIYQIYPPELLYFNLTIRREPQEGFTDLGTFLAEDEQHGNFSYRTMWVPWEYMVETYPMSLIVGETYWFRWRADLDPLNFRVHPWHRWNESDPNAIMNIKYYDKKGELKVFTTIQDNDCNKTKEEVTPPLSSIADLGNNDAQIGDYYHNEDRRIVSFALGVTGREETDIDWIDIESTKSLTVNPEDMEREDFLRYWSEAANWAEGVPAAGDEVVIEERWQMVCDVPDTFALGRITIKGVLIVPNEVTTNLIIQARIIEVTTGELIIGSTQEPFKGMVKIKIISAETDLGENEQYGVLTSYGAIQMIGEPGRKTRESSLEKQIEIGATELIVGTALEWMAGDSILIAASGFGGESEKHVLQSYSGSSGSAILSAAVEYAHLKGTSVYNVAGYHITVEGRSEEEWGGRVIIEDRETDELYYVAKVHFKHVLFSQMGHYHNEANVFRFYYYNFRDSVNWAVVEDCSFVDIYGGALMAIDSSNIEFRDNIIYRPYMLGLLTERANNLVVSGNVMLSVEDVEWKKWWLLKGLTYQGGFFICPFTRFKDCQNITLENNQLIGSETIGYATQGLPCKDWDPVTHTISNNSAMSTTYIGWWLAATDWSAIHCVSLSDFHMQHNLNYSVFCENKTYGMELNNGVFDTVFESIGFGDGVINHTFNGSFTGLTFIGNHEHGSILNTKKRPQLERSHGYEFDNLGVEYIYTDPCNHFNMCDNTAYFYDTTFKNFEELELTKKHAALWVSERWDTYSHEFLYPYILYKGITFENVDFSQLLLWESWFQHLISFEDVKFIGDPWNLNGVAQLGGNFQLVNNTVEIGDHLTNCTRQTALNAYYCENENLGMLCLNTHLEVAKHFHVWREDGFHSTDFSRRQLVIDGDIRRVSWLISLVEAIPSENPTYTLKFDSSLPPKITYFLLGQPKSKGVHLKIEYQKPQSIHLYWNEVRQDRKFFSSLESVRDAPALTVCGDNLWRVIDNVLELYVNGDEEYCAIRAEQVNALMVSLRVECTIEEFFAGNMQNKFIDQVAAVLSIPIHRIRIVGIYKGSTVVKTFIDQDPKHTSTEEAQQELRILKTLLEDAVSKGVIDIGAKILEFGVEEAFVTKDPTQEEEKGGDDDDDDNNLVLALAVAFAVGLIIVGIIIFLICKNKKKRSKKIEDIFTGENQEENIRGSEIDLMGGDAVQKKEVEAVEVKQGEQVTPREEVVETDEDFIPFPVPGAPFTQAVGVKRLPSLIKKTKSFTLKGEKKTSLLFPVTSKEEGVGSSHKETAVPFHFGEGES